VARLSDDEGLAGEHAIDDKLTSFTMNKREREAKKPSPLAQALAMHGPVRELPIATSGRIPIEEGDRPEIPLEQRSLLVPARFLEAKFSTYRPKTEGQQTALDSAEAFVTRVLNGQPTMLALLGKQGTGKSHLLYAAANRFLAMGRRIYSRPWYKLADELRYGGRSPFNDDALEAHEVRAQLWKFELLFIDEVRPTASTSLDETELAKLACHVYDARSSLFISTNMLLEDVMGAAAASRFAQVVIDGPDHRQQA
jgi:hypothetical protein